MKLLRTFLRRPITDQFLLIWTSILVLGVRVSLKMFRFQSVRRALIYMMQSNTTKQSDTAVVDRIIWAVDAASNRLLPAGPCLTKALVAQMLLARRGYLTTLRIGVQRDHTGLAAHAWLEHGGKIVVGQIRNMRAFTPLPPLELETL